MCNKNIKNFFNSIADSWDSREIITDTKINTLLKNVGINTDDKVLDVGCGTGRITSLLHNLTNQKIIGIDISDKMIEIAKEKYKDKNFVTFISDDFYNHIFEEKFDKIIIYNAYPHFMDKNKFNDALYRNLKTDGEFAILHSFSRFQLQDVHRNCDSISCNLKSPIQEYEYFKKSFKLIKAIEDDNSYILICRKN